jgi:hypothetical protein
MGLSRRSTCFRLGAVIMIAILLPACRNPHHDPTFNPTDRPIGRPLLRRFDDVPDTAETQFGRFDQRLERILY